MHRLFIGTSGYNYKEWKEKFYPRGLPQTKWLAYYASQFNTVEINNSFYTSVKKETYEKWYEQTPPEFTFVIKGHRYITQYKKLKNVGESVEQFFAQASGLREKMNCVLWQFPGNFVLSSNSDEIYNRLETFLKLLPQHIRHAFEFRDESWFVPEVNDLFKQYNASLVLSQSDKFPEIEMFNNTFAYIRFHGPTGLYSSKYADDDLKNWADRMKALLKSQDVYAYFNNDLSGYAIQNTQTLIDFLK
jgi:uncharacterized protein YecE (DUF72 family)